MTKHAKGGRRFGKGDRYDPRIEVLELDHHRNGIGGAPFDVVRFLDLDENLNLIGIVFDQPNHVAILNTDKLTGADATIAFGVNSWRGDRYEKPLREAIAGRVASAT